MPIAPATHDESSRFDFVEGVRAYNYRELVSRLIEEYPQRVAQHVEQGGREPSTKEEAGTLYNHDPDYLFSCRIQRTMQQISWANAFESVHRAEDRLLEQLQTSRERTSPARLELDPDFELPQWYTEHTQAGRDDIHLVPGGYWRDELVGPVYDRGGAAYRLAWRGGYDARPGALHTFARSHGLDRCNRILDVGCSFGGLTRALRQTHPDADEVIGIDISAPALTYAHHLASEHGQEIVYSQRDATATGYKDESFDLVAGFLLLHEVTDGVRAEIVKELFRILRPGGRLMFLDIPPYRALSPVEAYFESFDGRGNGENFWEEFLASDFPGLLGSTGFTKIEEGPLDYDEPGYWGSSALWRTGEFNPVHRWVTRAVRP